MFDEFCSLVSSESPSGSTSINKLSRLVELCWRWYAHAVDKIARARRLGATGIDDLGYLVQHGERAGTARAA